LRIELTVVFLGRKLLSFLPWKLLSFLTLLSLGFLETSEPSKYDSQQYGSLRQQCLSKDPVDSRKRKVVCLHHKGDGSRRDKIS